MPPPAPTPDFVGVLPDRAIGVHAPQTIGPASMAGLFVLLFGLLGGALWWLGPDIARDWRIAGELIEARGASLEQARCTSRLAVFTVCEVAFADTEAGGQRQTLQYFFIATPGPEPIVLLRTRSEPGSLTTNLGLQKLYHRTFALLLIVALLVWCIALSAQVIRDGVVTRKGLAALSGQRLRPVVVALEGKIAIAHKRRRWTYRYDADGIQQRAYVELPSSIDPLFVTSDAKNALALVGPGGGVPLLLDAQLSALDLSEAEKEAFFARCRAALQEQSQP